MNIIDYASENNLEKVKECLENGADVNLQGGYGRTALAWASWYKNENIVQLLLENKADVNIQDSYGDTALLWASRRGSENIVQLLLENGADVNIQNEFGKTALIVAREVGNTKMVKLLEKGGGKKWKLNYYRFMVLIETLLILLGLVVLSKLKKRLGQIKK